MTPLSLVRAAEQHGSPLRPTAVVAFAVFTLGTALYTIGVTAWSGRRVASLDVPPDAAATAVVGPVRLAPRMNPVRVLANVGFEPPVAGSLSCRVILRDAAGRIVWSERRGFGTRPAGRAARAEAGRTLSLSTFDVPREGDYTFAVSFAPAGTGGIHAARLEVREHVATPRTWFVVTGLLLALASLVVALLGAPRDRDGEHPGRALPRLPEDLVRRPRGASADRG